MLAAALALGFVPLLATPDAAPMAVLLAVSGLALPPLLTAVFMTADRWAPSGTVAEAFAWVATAFAVGSAVGSALTGPLAAADIRYGFALAPTVALGSVAVMIIVSRGDATPGPAEPDVHAGEAADRVEDNEGLGLRHRETDQHGTFEPSGDDRNAGENPSQGRDAGAPGEASER